ncbi:molecular chaperone [Cohnella terricola]|uniref:Molecular chaperone n=1 Tax=Cohnella terricola TaxID=1289167 RepID=A0A559J5E1_9BACL|nr:molecular chaperone [Cohnella terricola]TVX95108.1 molecular chaperone [Cohnella terricola]
MEMTTYQLRNVCFRERLVDGLVQTLDREELIRTILKYRSAEASLFIRQSCLGGFDRVEAAARTYLNTPLKQLGDIRIPARIVLYIGMATDRQDRYRIEAGEELSESNALLVNEDGELCGILNVVKDATEAGVYYLQAGKDAELKRTKNRNYSLLFFRKLDSDYLYKTYYSAHPMPPTNLHYGKVPVAELEIRELEETTAVLAIDFGTSNTTAGAYLDSSYISSPPSHDVMNGRIRLNAINYVSFADMSGKQGAGMAMLPTVVSAADCSDPAAIQFYYGHDSLKQLKKNSYSGHATVFRGMKRWVNHYEKIEELTDPHGNVAQMKRSDIIRAYLLHVIETAEHQFKCRFNRLHFTSPVKLKSQSLEMFKEILPEYEIESEHALDEGMAVLYNTIADQIEKNNLTDGSEYQALVIDCGGGTTDVSSCRFRIEDGHVAYKIDIHTAYENGDTNFGGNNLTYRIMQYMKIVFADYYTHGRAAVTDIDTLIPIPGTDLFRYVDEEGIDAVYDTFKLRYEAAEAIIPTKYKQYEVRARDDYRRVRGNYYFLWEIAERMKTEFFRRTGILRNRFLNELGDKADNDLIITPVDRWCISVLDNGEFKDMNECPDVVFTIKEMTQLLRADIYEIVRKFLDEFYQDGRLQDYSIIKLTGQSCRIDVFREALKEFVPGRSIEFRQKSEDPGQVPDLKLACLRGAIRYQADRKAGYIESWITNEVPTIPYSVSAFTHNRREKMLMSSLERSDPSQTAISRPIGASEVEFHLKGSDGSARYTYVYTNRLSDYKSVLYEDIAALYGDRIRQEDTDSIMNGEAKFFVSAGNNRWGFEVIPVARIDDQLQLGKKRFFPFENEATELDFFDGLK